MHEEPEGMYPKTHFVHVVPLYPTQFGIGFMHVLPPRTCPYLHAGGCPGLQTLELLDNTPL